MPDIAVSILNQIEALFQEVNTELAQRPVDPSTVASMIAWQRGGSGKIGVESVFTLPFFGNRAKKRSPYEELPGTVPEIATFSVTHEEWAPDAELIARYTQLTDLHGIITDNMPTILSQAQIEYEVQLAGLLAGGATGTTRYDNLPFFSTAHEVNPSRPGAFVPFSNYNAAATLNRANIIAAFDALDAMPGPDGNPLSMPGRLTIVCSTEDQVQRARLELTSQFVPSAAGTATQSNTLLGRADVVKLVPLRSYNSGKGWYVVKVADAKHRPFVNSIIQAPQVYLTGVSVDDYSQVLKAVTRQGWRAVHGMGYLWPHLCIGNIEP